MNYIRKYNMFESNSRLETRAKLNQCWHNAKIGDVVPGEWIYNYIQYLHDDYEGGFIYGDLGERIEQYESYRMCEIPTDLISSDWSTDRRMVDEYERMTSETEDYPPVVLEGLEDGKYTVIDGSHRLKAISKRSEKIKAWVGTNK
jgi:hypothetical protein